MRKIPCFVNGKEIFNPADTHILYNYNNEPELEIHCAEHWTVEAAIETASRLNHKLCRIPREKVFTLLRDAVKIYFADSESYNLLARTTASPFSFIKDSLEKVKQWVANIAEYYEAVTPDIANCHSSAPTVTVLPNNSELESPYILAVTLASKNCSILRPSTKGPGSYTSFELIKAIKTVADASGDADMRLLSDSINMVNTSGRDYLPQLSISGWNYIFFGDNDSIETMSNIVMANASHGGPRKILDYGTGLSSSIVLADSDIAQSVQDVAESICVNVGNECVSTDVLYIHDSIYEEFMDELRATLKQFPSGDPFDPESNGFIRDTYLQSLLSEADVRGFSNRLNLRVHGGRTHVDPTLLELHDFEYAIEYPGPICSVRRFNNKRELERLTIYDRKNNRVTKNLATSIFTSSWAEFHQLLNFVRAYTIYWNRPTHSWDMNGAHQGRHLLRELSDTQEICEVHAF